MIQFKPIYYIYAMDTNGLKSARLFSTKTGYKKALKRMQKSVWLSHLSHGEFK